MRAVAIAAALWLAACGFPALAEDGLETPSSTKEFVVAPKPGSGQENAHWACAYYRAWMIKSVHYDGPNDGMIWSKPLDPTQALPPCSAAPLPGQTRVSESDYFIGLAGDLVVTSAGDGYNSGVGFGIRRAADGRLLYNDLWLEGADPVTGQEPSPRYQRADGLLTITYRRIVTGPCSIAFQQDACWTRFAREMHFPKELTGRPVPIGACRLGLASPRVSQQADMQRAPSVLAYEVTMSIAPNGKTNVLSRGEFECWPST